STGTLDALRKNKSITLNTLHDICMLLDCEIADVVEFKKDNH
ncbi:MAG: helix-turn-helix domain-containing protein, partial [Lachnospiraceae bacterium]